MKKLIGIIIVVVLIAILFIIHPAEKMKKIRIGYCPLNADLPFFVALDKGYFRELGLDIEPIKCGDSSEALNALLANKVDLIAPISFSAFFSIEAEAPGQIKIFLPGGETEGNIVSYLLIRKDSTISSIEELRGKKIGTYTGVTQLLYLKLFLKKVGIDPEKDVQIIQVGPNLQAQALDAEQFDALFTVEPYATIAITKGIAKPLVENPRSRYIVDPFISGAAGVSSKFLEKHPEEVKKIYKSMAKAVDFIRSNESEAKNLLPKYTPLEQQVAQQAGLYRFYKIDEPFDMAAVQKLSDLLYEYEILNRRVEAQEMFLLKEQLE